MVYSECEHAAATLIHILDKSAAPDSDDITVAVDGQLIAWVQAVNGVVRTEDDPGSGNHEHILYLLEPAQRSWRDANDVQPINISVFRARMLRGGVFGRLSPVPFGQLKGEDGSSFYSIDDPSNRPIM
ncbi:MAG: hypothetical protein AAFY56_24495 [Pseudomonadota bacterium]